MTTFKHVAVAVIIVFIVAVFGLFALNIYLRLQSGNDLNPPVIYERSDRPSRA